MTGRRTICAAGLAARGCCLSAPRRRRRTCRAPSAAWIQPPVAPIRGWCRPRRWSITTTSTWSMRTSGRYAYIWSAACLIACTCSRRALRWWRRGRSRRQVGKSEQIGDSSGLFSRILGQWSHPPLRSGPTGRYWGTGVGGRPAIDQSSGRPLITDMGGDQAQRRGCGRGYPVPYTIKILNRGLWIRTLYARFS